MGAIFRFALAGALTSMFPAARLPLGTLGVNMLGCLAIGLLSAAVETSWQLGPNTRALLFVGVLGSFTTFSTFAFESEFLVREGDYWRMFAYVGLHLVLGFALVFIGRALILRA